MGVADNFEEVAKIEFFYDQSPEGMKSLGTSYFTSSLGIGNFLSRFILSTVSKITKSMATKEQKEASLVEAIKTMKT
ncbi:hypothetical protein OIU77_024168 [Salix suchowensis]|uniref:Uncharacterized protein n=1 Tax=Salix suchowensis TaxID=1278906 RepID=A0ABQ9BUB0_9ROSI|nr:hypothetical protein OIU77_024168 [Salix suchowensis]